MRGRYTARQSYFLEASPTAVFRALTNPEALTGWFLSAAKVEPRKGGAFEFDWIGGYHMESTLSGFVRNQAVSFLWVDRLPNGKFVTTYAGFTLKKKGKGTLLVLRHEGFNDPGHFAECSSRWAYYLTNLKSVLAHGKDLRSEFDW